MIIIYNFEKINPQNTKKIATKNFLNPYKRAYFHCNMGKYFGFY